MLAHHARIATPDSQRAITVDPDPPPPRLELVPGGRDHHVKFERARAADCEKKSGGGDDAAAHREQMAHHCVVSLCRFRHVEGCGLCKGLYPHVVVAGETWHLYHTTEVSRLRASERARERARGRHASNIAARAAFANSHEISQRSRVSPRARTLATRTGGVSFGS